MISFYRYVFDNYPNELIKSVQNLIHKNYFYKYKKDPITHYLQIMILKILK